MPRSTVTLEVLQPGDRTARVLEAVLEALGAERVEGRDDGFVRVRSGMAYPVALTRVRRVLFMHDPGGEFVRVLEGQ